MTHIHLLDLLRWTSVDDPELRKVATRYRNRTSMISIVSSTLLMAWYVYVANHHVALFVTRFVHTIPEIVIVSFLIAFALMIAIFTLSLFVPIRICETIIARKQRALLTKRPKDA